jgi:diacylglycerol O-acyltransferase / wax synthase
MSNVLDLLDQTMFDYAQASGSTTRLQCVWVYNRPVNIDGLRQFHAHLERGRLSRCIAHSPLPFGRSRWVAPDNLPELEIAVAARPREAFDGWLDEQSNSPLDCEHGPAWHLAVLPFTDGGAGVSLTIDHCLVDGVGLWEAVADAALGRDDPIDWPDAASRGRWRALREDARQTVSDIPAMSRAVVAAMKLGRSGRNGATAAAPPATDPPPPPSEADESHNLPTATVFVDADEWEARARSLGGTSNTLLVGLATRLAQRAGRVATDGSVVVTLPVNERTPDDTRANAISGVLATVNTESATTDLRGIRAAVKQALIRHQEEPDPAQVLNALVPLLSKRLLKAARGATRVSAFNLVGASNVGVTDAAASRPDGTEADSYAIRLHHLGVDTPAMRQYGGLQTLLSGTVQGRVFVSLISYLPGRTNSKDELHQELSTALSEYSLNGAFL